MYTNNTRKKAIKDSIISWGCLVITAVCFGAAVANVAFFLPKEAKVEVDKGVTESEECVKYGDLSKDRCATTIEELINDAIGETK